MRAALTFALALLIASVAADDVNDDAIGLAEARKASSTRTSKTTKTTAKSSSTSHVKVAASATSVDRTGLRCPPPKTTTATGGGGGSPGPVCTSVAQASSLTAPSAPTGLTRAVTIQLPSSPPNNASPVIASNFIGFSIELSAISRFVGSVAGQVPQGMINHLRGLTGRSKSSIVIRVGGGSQDRSTYDASSTAVEGSNTVGAGLWKNLNAISAATGAKWIPGLNLLTFGKATTDMAAAAFEQLGSNLQSLELGNEPDLYSLNHASVAKNTTACSYLDKLDAAIRQTVADHPALRKPICGGPSTYTSPRANGKSDFAAGHLSPYFLGENSGLINEYSQHTYPATACTGCYSVQFAQNAFNKFVDRTNVHYGLDAFDSASISAIRGRGVPLVLGEAGSASCGGLSAVSNAFIASIWTVDFSLAAAIKGFSRINYHGSSSAWYNAFYASSNTFTTQPPYYGALLFNEAIGSRNAAQVVDLGTKSGSTGDYYPSYAIFENGKATRVVLFNYITDSTGASDRNVTLAVSSPSVSVKYLTASTTSELTHITYAGQTYAGQTDGTPKGELQVKKIQCAGGQCHIPVPAPAVALVFLNDAALAEVTV